MQPRAYGAVDERPCPKEGHTMEAKFIAAAVIGLAASACTYAETTVPAPPPAPVAVAPATVTYVSPPAPVPTTTVYTPYVPVPEPVTVTPAAPTATVGVEAFRDEYGFRYDAEGNRLDRYGNIISPQSTIP